MKLKLTIITLLAVASLEATTLKEAVQQGIKTDSEILAKIAHHNGKNAAISLAKTGNYPTLDVDTAIGLEENDKDNLNSVETNTNYTRKEISAHLRQPLFDGFKTSSDIAYSYADKKTAGYELAALCENKSLDIVKAYFDILKAKEISNLADTNLKVLNDILDSIEQRYKQGISNKADLILIKGHIASAKTDIFSAKNNILDAKATYLKVVGNMPDLLEKPSKNDIIIPSTLEKAISKSTKKNPTILAALENIKLVKSQRNKINSGNYPQLFLDLNAKYKDNADGIKGTQENYQAMMRLEWNLFNGFKNNYKKEIAQQDLISANKKAQNTKRQLVLETTLSWNAYILLKKQLILLQQHVSYSTEAKKLYEEQYNVGRRSLLDVLNSQIEVFNATKTMITVKYDERIAQYRILNSIGTLNNNLNVIIY